MSTIFGPDLNLLHISHWPLQCLSNRNETLNNLTECWLIFQLELSTRTIILFGCFTDWVIVFFFSAPDDWHSPLKDPLVLELAEKYNKTVAQIALRFTVQRGIPVVPNTKNPDRLAENLKVIIF